MRTAPVDVSACLALVVIGIVSGVAIIAGGNPGLTVAAAGVGAIGGWLTRGAVAKAAAAAGPAAAGEGDHDA